MGVPYRDSVMAPTKVLVQDPCPLGLPGLLKMLTAAHVEAWTASFPCART